MLMESCMVNTSRHLKCLTDTKVLTVYKHENRILNQSEVARHLVIGPPRVGHINPNMHKLYTL